MEQHYTLPGAVYRSYEPRWFEPVARVAYRAALWLGCDRGRAENVYAKAFRLTAVTAA